MVRLARRLFSGSAANRLCLLRQRHTGKQKRVLVGICAIGLARWNVFVLRHRTIRKMGAVHVGTDLEYPVLPVSAGGLKMDEQRKYAILFAATILAARKLNEIGVKSCPARECAIADAVARQAHTRKD